MKNTGIPMQRRIFMRNVISQIADPAQPAYQGVVRDHFPCWVWCLGVTRRAYIPQMLGSKSNTKPLVG